MTTTIRDCELLCPRCRARVVYGLDCGCAPVERPEDLAQMLADQDDEDRTRRAERLEDIAFVLACAAVCLVALMQVLS